MKKFPIAQKNTSILGCRDVFYLISLAFTTNLWVP